MTAGLAVVGAASSGGSALWYLSRATGVVSLVLLTLVVLGGVLVRTGSAAPRLPRFVMLGLHRNVALMTLAFLALHVTTVVLDQYVPINLSDVFVPFGSAYRPLWLGLGTVALDLLLAIVVTSLLRVRIGLRAWRVVHWSTYAAWPVALVHGLGTGSDAGQRWMLLLTVACLATVAGAVAWRLQVGGAQPVAQPPAPSRPVTPPYATTAARQTNTRTVTPR